MGKAVQAKSNLKERYWNGVFTGVFLGCFVLSVAILVTVRLQGLQVAINPELLAKMVEDRVRTELRRELPQLIEGFKREIPEEVDNHLDHLNHLKIRFGQSEVKLPDEVLAAIKLEFNRIIESAVRNTLNDYDTSKHEDRLAKDAYEMVHQIIRRDIIGKTYLIKSAEWLTIPVRIVGTSKESLKIKL
ncbi:MAG TPA: hypothetical protein PLC07_11750 [Bacillota bacterium]|nr:hypothetical protein [Bacillota bacterium]HPT88512.1 hypothetical protein [Bacillota bacterium]